MDAMGRDSKLRCRERLEHFFGGYRDEAMQASAIKALRFLADCGEPLLGRPEG